jgi:hypothetical protein
MGIVGKENKDEKNFWIFVDLMVGKKIPDYYIVPEWWIQNDIYKTHKAYLNKHGGKRPGNKESKHHSVTTKRIIQWKDCWDILKVFR